VRVDADRAARLIDFWVRRANGEHLLAVDHGRLPTELPESIDGAPLKLIPAAELAAAATWTANWLRMIPVINATG